jgi:uncharacterized protein YegJ (DUF2314 family)
LWALIDHQKMCAFDSRKRGEVKKRRARSARKHELFGNSVRPTPGLQTAVCGMVKMRPVFSKCSSLIAVMAAVALLGAATVSVRAEDRSPVIDVRTGDPEMNAAIAQARTTLPKFWASYEAPKPSETGHSLKVRFPYGNNNGEHIWMAEVAKIGGDRYSGRFANAPVHLHGKRAGDQVEFKEADISDWMYLRNGKIVGGETIKPMLKLMTKADADALRARMETP